MSSIKRVCVYCGSSSGAGDLYRETADALGKLLVEMDMGLVFGGGNVGLMGVVSNSVLDAGGEAIGIIPGHLADMEVAHNGLTELHVVGSMHERKQMMVDLSDAFIILPGGLGTMDEFFEILTWYKLSLHDKPIIVLNVDDYWSPLEKLIDNIVDQGFASEKDRGILKVLSDISDVREMLAMTSRGEKAVRTDLM
jgi:uncharacterized protein (TIGR00730 family)